MAALLLVLLVLASSILVLHYPVAAAIPAHPLLQDGASEEGILAIVGASETNLYDAPGGAIIHVFSPGAVLTAYGRTADSQWYVVTSSINVADTKAGWVEANQVVVFGADQLPIMMDGPATLPTLATAAVPIPSSTPTPTLTQVPTATPTPSATATATAAPAPTATPTATGIMTTQGGSTNDESTSHERQISNGLVAVVRGGGAELFDAPEGNVTLALPTGAAVTALARSANTRWIYIRTGGDERGWVRVDTLVAFDLTTLPVVTDTELSAAQTTQEETVTAPTADGITAPSAVDTVEPPAVSASASPGTQENVIRVTVALTDSRLNVRTGPGTEFTVVGQLLPAQEAVAIGRNEPATWLLLSLPEFASESGWIAAEFVTPTGSILRLPVIATQETIEAPVVAASSLAPPAVAESSSGEVSTGEPGLQGRMVLQSRAGGTIYVYLPATGALYELTTGFDPAISPDGQVVAFTRTGGELGLYLIDVTGANERRIYVGEALRGPTWSPDGQLIAFTRAVGTYQCRELGFGICLPDNPFLTDFPLVNKPERGLSRVDTNGQNFRDLPALTSVSSPSWGPAGLVYHSNTSLEITQDMPDATTAALLTAPYYQAPVWQPSGDRILFQSREGSHWEIFAVNSDGSGVGALTRPVTALVDELPSNVAPAWSPNGQTIAYLSNRTAENSAGPWRLWVMNAAGGNQRPLPVNVAFDYSYTGERMISWGP